MGGADTMGAQIGRPLPNARQEASGVGGGASSGRSGVRIRRNVRYRGYGERIQRRRRGRGVGAGSDEVVDCYRIGAGGLPIRSPCGGGDLAGGGPNLERGR